MLRATTACTFSTSQLPKVVRQWCVLYILTSKCASRHNGVHFFISHLASWLRTRRFSEPTFRPSGAPNHWKNTVFRDFPTFSRICIFFLLNYSFSSTLLSSNLSLLSASSLLCFSSVHIVGSLTSKLPSIKGPAAAAAIMSNHSNLISYCSMAATFACIWYIDSLPFRLFGASCRCNLGLVWRLSWSSTNINAKKRCPLVPSLLELRLQVCVSDCLACSEVRSKMLVHIGFAHPAVVESPLHLQAVAHLLQQEALDGLLQGEALAGCSSTQSL